MLIQCEVCKLYVLHDAVGNAVLCIVYGALYFKGLHEQNNRTHLSVTVIEILQENLVGR